MIIADSKFNKHGDAVPERIKAIVVKGRVFTEHLPVMITLKSEQGYMRELNVRMNYTDLVNLSDQINELLENQGIKDAD